MHRVSKLAQHIAVTPQPVTYSRIAHGDYEKSKHKLKSGDTVVITGAAGFVGGWLVTYCLQRGYTVRACVRDVDDDKKTGFMKEMSDYGTKLTLHAADMTVEHAYDDIFEGAHTIFHPAEVFMSAGRPTGWARGSGQKISEKMLHENAMQTCQFMVDSINKSSTVRRLIYTSSIAAMMPTVPGAYRDNPIIDEDREPHASHASPYGYNMTKRSTEHFFAYEAARSGGKWSTMTGNPGDIVGPILSPHQAHDTWQGKVATVLSGKPTVHEGGRPWLLVDARDVAMAEILLAESGNVESGERFMLSSGDKIHPEDWGGRITELFPGYSDLPAVTEPPIGGEDQPPRNDPMWIRVYLRHDKIANALGFRFRSFDETLRDMIMSLESIGGVQYNCAS